MIKSVCIYLLFIFHENICLGTSTKLFPKNKSISLFHLFITVLVVMCTGECYFENKADSVREWCAGRGTNWLAL